MKKTTIFAAAGAFLFLAASSALAQSAKEIVEASGIKGGLIVHIGCGDGRLTAGLRVNERFLVHGLDTDAENIKKAREHLRSRGLYGKVTVERFGGRRLPYVDNLVNLVVSENLDGVSMEEVMRVLCPGGIASIREGGTWKRTEKPRPKGMGEWTHYLHDPQGTSVGKDRIVGLPRRLQWVGGPKWLRNHDFMASLSGMVSASGRVFYIIDEGLRSHIYLPARWAVVARDGFNGTLLWKRRIDAWFPHTWPFKSGPADLPRRIVAVGERVYLTLGLTAPLTILDAATGEMMRTYDGTKGTEEILLSKGVLFLLVNPDKKLFAYKHASTSRGQEQKRVNEEFGWSIKSPERLLMAVSADTGEILWKHRGNIANLTPAVGGGKVFYYDGKHVVALDRESGAKKWTSEDVGETAKPATGYAPRLIAGDGIVVLSTKAKTKQGRLVGISADDGKTLWGAPQPSSGHYSPEDLFLIDGVLWTAQTGKTQTPGTHFVGIVARTGETKHDFVAEQIEAYFMHQRCYPGRATERYIMASGTGTEMLELGTKKCELHHWLRGSCIYGMMPCNGLLYKPPDSCACYYQSKLADFCALAPSYREGRRPAGGSRLEKGPAYGEAEGGTADGWPTYRHDVGRSGSTKTELPGGMKQAWRAEIGGALSTLTVAGGKVYVSAIDRHTVHALAADSGEKIWSYTAGGRVDSPPTIHGGLVLFGSADGWVTCLRASDGRLAWRYRAAPGDDKLLSYQQVESVWPVHGSVLVLNGVVYAIAGRNMFVDGGMRLVRLEAATGKLLSETVLDDKDPRTGKNLQTLMAGKAVPVTSPDILSWDGKHIYMKTQKFDLEGKRVDLDLVKGKENEQRGEGRHLFCPTGFLDDYWFHRSYWIFGKNAGEGHGEYGKPRSHTQTGRIMVFDASKIYSFYAQNVGNNINPRTSHSLYAISKDLPPVGAPAPEQAPKRRKGKQAKPQKARIAHLWEVQKPGLLPNAMVLVGGNLCLAGPPDVADEEKTFGFVYGGDDEIHQQMRRQEEAWRGGQGALLWIVSAESGERRAEHKLAAIPVWDGMVAAEGRLFLSLRDGSVVCWGGE